MSATVCTSQCSFGFPGWQWYRVCFLCSLELHGMAIGRASSLLLHVCLTVQTLQTALPYYRDGLLCGLCVVA
jgi:hypothetical protein